MEERPRDRLGRPLPNSASPELVTPGVPQRSHLSSSDAWTEAMNYLELGLPFHAHEVLEQRWRCCPPDERPIWRALAQWAAALTHEARGNPTGSTQVAERARAGLDAYPQPPEPVDATFVRASLERLASGSDTGRC